VPDTEHHLKSFGEIKKVGNKQNKKTKKEKIFLQALL
jgi:hypothetical protein